MAEITRPNFSQLWANGGAVVAPSAAKIELGWTIEIPPHQWENWAQNRQDTALGYLFQRGVPAWDPATEYYAAKSVVFFNSTLYLATQNSVNVSPTNTSYWIGLKVLRAAHADTADSATNAINADHADTADFAEVVRLSPDSGNLLNQRANGLYYGTVSPAEFAIMYVNTATGNDTNPGTEALPKRTIKGVIDSGPAGIVRECRLYEGQEHIVDPANLAKLRGGSCYFRPYGPMTNALPAVPGRAPWDTDTARAFNTRITSLQFATVTIGSAQYQSAPALVAENGSFGFSAITLNCGAPNASGLPMSSQDGTFSQTTGTTSISTSFCNINLPSAQSGFMSSRPGDPQVMGLWVAHIAGAGKLLQSVNNNNNVQVSDTDATSPPAAIAGYIGGVGKAPDVLYNVTTNLNPNLFP